MFSGIKERKFASSMAKTTKPTGASTHYDPLSHRVDNLKRERAELEEEVLQLRAAVHIWKAVRRQTMFHEAGSEALSAETR